MRRRRYTTWNLSWCLILSCAPLQTRSRRDCPSRRYQDKFGDGMATWSLHRRIWSTLTFCIPQPSSVPSRSCWAAGSNQRGAPGLCCLDIHVRPKDLFHPVRACVRAFGAGLGTHLAYSSKWHIHPCSSDLRGGTSCPRSSPPLRHLSNIAVSRFALLFREASTPTCHPCPGLSKPGIVGHNRLV